jgi:hypothetical protein
MNEDEARVRKAFDVPADATLLSLHASPDSTGLQREGLRIVATFHVKTPAFATWSPLPLPSSVGSLGRPPSELVIPAGAGKYRCEVGVYTTGTSHAMTPCSSPLPPHFDMYEVATFDESSGALSTVMQFYY